MGGWYVTDTGGSVIEWLGTPEEEYFGLTVALWQLVVVVYVLGDTALTTVVLELGGYEASPVARAFVSTLGYPGLVLQKLLTMSLLLGLWRYYPTVGVDSPDPWRLVVPAIPLLRGLQLLAIHVNNVLILL